MASAAFHGLTLDVRRGQNRDPGHIRWQVTMQYRLATQEDVPRLRDLMNAQYARKQTDAYFHWQYFSSAWPTRVMCTVVDGQVMGMFGMQQRTLVDGTRVGQAIDLLLEPSLRGSGAFAEMGARILREFPDLHAVCVLPNLNGRNAVARALGWRELGKVDALEWPTTQPQPPVPPPSSLPPPRLRFAWDAAVLDWRFSRHPQHRYAWLGPVLTKRFVDPVTGRSFGDLVLPDGTPGDLHAAAGALASQAVGRVSTWALPHTPLRSTLLDLGFAAAPIERYFCLRVLDARYSHLDDFSAWSIVPADAEFF